MYETFSDRRTIHYIFGIIGIMIWIQKFCKDLYLGPNNNPLNFENYPDYDLDNIGPRTIICKGGFCGDSDLMLRGRGFQSLDCLVILILIHDAAHTLQKITIKIKPLEKKANIMSEVHIYLKQIAGLEIGLVRDNQQSGKDEFSFILS